MAERDVIYLGHEKEGGVGIYHRRRIMRIRSGCSVNRKIFFIVLVTLLFGTFFSTMSTFGEDGSRCIDGGCYNGEGTFAWSDGGKYVGGFKDGNVHGQGAYTFPDGSKNVGEFKDDKYLH